ncbi:glycosyl transferase [Pseudomonas daroniae]|uniref:Glycosyl transferase n=1 Tax=Phytopseudomonas daroniae TaxID=2487519 RepID=A0A4Q9QT47_9GAMM|nr:MULTISPECIES: glycosyltransferase family A protein [Pseudomonas]TBU83011.1 glycosyl transferase [Pseudomonas sp. FRB 228]TBU83976.1 glycosyl transferase [Pseudomonas daroniae]TBU93154.1 glycosyl transferase [Pseudomonas daroniae]
MPTVTVIVPNFNHRDYLEERLASIFNQTFDDYEVLLLDDASTDSSAELLQSYATHLKVSQLIINKDNSGSTFKQWNSGIEKAQGKYIWIAESDDRAEPNFLSTMVMALEADERKVIAYSQSTRIDKTGAAIGDWGDWTEDLAPGLFKSDFEMSGIEFVERLLIHRNVIPNASAVLFRRENYLFHAKADPTVKYCGDWLSWLKLALSGNVHYSAQKLNHFRQHEKSVIATRAANQKASFIKKYDIVMRKKLNDYLSAIDAPVSLREKSHALLRKDAEKEARLAIRNADRENERRYNPLVAHNLSGTAKLRAQLRLLSYKIKTKMKSR